MSQTLAFICICFFFLQTSHSNVIGIQVLNPIAPDSTEQLVVYDYQEVIESEVQRDGESHKKNVRKGGRQPWKEYIEEGREG